MSFVLLFKSYLLCRSYESYIGVKSYIILSNLMVYTHIYELSAYFRYITLTIHKHISVNFSRQQTKKCYI